MRGRRAAGGGPTGRCIGLAEDVVRCLTPTSAEECDLGARDVCSDARASLRACVWPPGDCETPVSVVRGGDDGEMRTTTEIHCPSVVYGSICVGLFEPGVDDVPCTCFIDGTEVGTCRDGVMTSGWCCAQFFAENDVR